ncbi:MAG: hypothetical protein ACR2PX_07710 [Endozoicomonas sp.]|uniref:hypothetical protein n=1 Tax=Endozoicomonas sp. TaxID=1892382 RepID=UPI003D9B1FCE
MGSDDDDRAEVIEENFSRMASDSELLGSMLRKVGQKARRNTRGVDLIKKLMHTVKE